MNQTAIISFCPAGPGQYPFASALAGHSPRHSHCLFVTLIVDLTVDTIVTSSSPLAVSEAISALPTTALCPSIAVNARSESEMITAGT
jgi:hypothetical protein